MLIFCACCCWWWCWSEHVRWRIWYEFRIVITLIHCDASSKVAHLNIKARCELSQLRLFFFHEKKMMQNISPSNFYVTCVHTRTHTFRRSSFLRASLSLHFHLICIFQRSSFSPVQAARFIKLIQSAEWVITWFAMSTLWTYKNGKRILKAGRFDFGFPFFLLSLSFSFQSISWERQQPNNFIPHSQYCSAENLCTLFEPKFSSCVITPALL